MKRIVIFLIIPGLLVAHFSRSQDTVHPPADLVGFCDRDGLEAGGLAEEFRLFYEGYSPDPDVLDELKPMLEGATIITVLGTWCSDSREQVPAFFRILDECRYDVSGIKLICVDREKKAGELDISAFGIVKVPTFIFYREGIEIGRIIETPTVSLEKDMVTILEQ